MSKIRVHLPLKMSNYEISLLLLGNSIFLNITPVIHIFSQTMATINVKEESSTPDSLSDYETKTHDKRLSLAEELDATQNELKEAEDKLTAAIQQVRSTFRFL